MDELLKYLTSFGIPQEHAEAIMYKLMKPTDMKEALTRHLQTSKSFAREDAGAEADRVLNTAAYLHKQGASDAGYDAAIKQAAALLAKPGDNRDPSSTPWEGRPQIGGTVMNLSDADTVAQLMRQRAANQAARDESRYVQPMTDPSAPYGVLGTLGMK